MVERGGTCKGEGQPRIPGIRTTAYARPGASRNAKARDLSGRHRSPSRGHAVSSRALARRESSRDLDLRRRELENILEQCAGFTPASNDFLRFGLPWFR